MPESPAPPFELELLEAALMVATGGDQDSTHDSMVLHGSSNPQRTVARPSRCARDHNSGIRKHCIPPEPSTSEGPSDNVYPAMSCDHSLSHLTAGGPS